MALHLYLLCKSTEYIEAKEPSKLKCIISTFDNEEISATSEDKGYCMIRNSCGFLFAGFHQFMLSKKIMKLSADSKATGSFSITCIIKTRGPIFVSTNCQLQNDIETLLKTLRFSDVELNVNKEVFHAHKLILAVRSPILAAMFEKEPLEESKGSFIINDIDVVTFNEMMYYIYTDKIPDFKTTVFSLLPAANKYQLVKLKTMCEIYLYNNLTMENVTNVLILADANSSTKLKAKAIEFINANPKEVIATDGYKSLTKSHPHLLDECYQAFVRNMPDVAEK